MTLFMDDHWCLFNDDVSHIEWEILGFTNVKPNKENVNIKNNLSSLIEKSLQLWIGWHCKSTSTTKTIKPQVYIIIFLKKCEFTYNLFWICEEQSVLIDEHSGWDSGRVKSIQKILDVVAEFGQTPTHIFTVTVWKKVNIFIFN